MHNYIAIGGFAFNHQALTWLDALDHAIQYIDINTLLIAPFTLEDLANTVIKQLTSPKNSLIAYSTGGLVALKIAELRPELIHQIILIHSTPKFLEDTSWPGISLKNFQRLRLKLTTLTLSNFMCHFSQMAALPQVINPHDYQDKWSKASLENLLALMAIIEMTDLRHVVQASLLNIHFIDAAHDSLVPFNATKHACFTDSTHLLFNQAELLPLLKTMLCL